MISKSFLFSLGMILALLVGFSAGIIAAKQLNIVQDFPVLKQAYEILSSHGLKDVSDSPDLEYGMIRGLVNSYNDPYTIFVEPVQHELESNELQGSFGGIGIQLDQDSTGYWILSPFPESPAQKAGILDGDRLLQVDKFQVEPTSSTDSILSAIRGPIGEPVKLTYGRSPDFQPITVSVKREEFNIPSVSWRVIPDEERLGVVKVNLITASSSDEILKAVDNLRSRGVTHFALDLRGNPGGLLEAGISIVKLFLSEGIILQQKFRDQPVKSFLIEEPGPLLEIPLVIFVNEGSASAAEIIAGTLKVHQRAIVIGSPTYGKDSIQLVFDLKDKSSIHVTAAKWWIPGLEPPVGKGGIQPDFLTQPNTSSNLDPDIETAIKYFFKTSK